MEHLDEWWSRGDHAHLLCPRGEGRPSLRLDLFYRVLGEGPWLTLLHGFPSCSWDWAAVAPALGARRRVLAFDFLGFGDSSKPPGHTYSLLQQADLTEELWRRQGVRETAIVAHDYGASVALELLARQAEGPRATRVSAVVLLNAGLYLDLYRPRLIQRLLRLPFVGALVSRAIGERLFRRSFAAVFAAAHRPDARALAQHWEAVARHCGHHRAHRLIGYIAERRLHGERWQRQLESGAVPLGFVWGLSDPVSGAAIAARLRERRPGAPFVALDDVGHYPQIEAPERVGPALLQLLDQLD